MEKSGKIYSKVRGTLLSFFAQQPQYLGMDGRVGGHDRLRREEIAWAVAHIREPRNLPSHRRERRLIASVCKPLKEC